MWKGQKNKRTRKRSAPVKADLNTKIDYNKPCGTIPKSQVPESLKHVPNFRVEGFAIKSNTKFTPSVMTWTNRAYMGLCPSCGNKIVHVKRMNGSDIEYSGVCDYCDIRSTITRDK